jgi:anti-anti-sigma factor
MTSELDPTPTPPAGISPAELPSTPALHDDVLTVTVEEHDTAPRIVLVGELDMHGLVPFTRIVDQVLRRHPTQVDVDAGGLRFIDSSGVKALVQARRRATMAGAAFRLVAVSEAVRRIIAMTGVEDHLMGEDEG